MLFRSDLQVPETTAAADWLSRACDGDFGTVGGLVPTSYASYLRIHPPADDRDWLLAYRQLFVEVASIGARHTSMPHRAWFALWEGHGALNPGNWSVAWRNPAVDEAERQRREVIRASVHEESLSQAASIRADLAAVPLFSRPHRSYHLVAGSVPSVAALGVPKGAAWRWHQPDLFWPEDRRWFVATDVDYSSIYVGGSDAFVHELANGLEPPTELVTTSYRPPED